jgi:hypothetical protein
MYKVMGFIGSLDYSGRVKEKFVECPLKKVGVQKVKHKRQEFLTNRIQRHAKRFPFSGQSAQTGNKG